MAGRRSAACGRTGPAGDGDSHRAQRAEAALLGRPRLGTAGDQPFQRGRRCADRLHVAQFGRHGQHCLADGEFQGTGR
jgi:hypothetical protein